MYQTALTYPPTPASLPPLTHRHPGEDVGQEPLVCAGVPQQSPNILVAEAGKLPVQKYFH